MQRVPKKPSIAKADLQNSTARLREYNVVVRLMEAGCFRYRGYLLGMVISRLRLKEENLVLSLMEAGCFRYDHHPVILSGKGDSLWSRRISLYIKKRSVMLLFLFFYFILRGLGCRIWLLVVLLMRILLDRRTLNHHFCLCL